MIKKFRDKLVALESTERNRIIQEKQLKIMQEAEKPLSDSDLKEYLENRRKYGNEKNYKTNFLKYYEHEMDFKDLFWLDKRFSDLENNHDQIIFLKENFKLSDDQAFLLCERFFEASESVNLYKKKIINGLPNRLIRDDESINNINKGIRLR